MGYFFPPLQLCLSTPVTSSDVRSAVRAVVALDGETWVYEAKRTIMARVVCGAYSPRHDFGWAIDSIGSRTRFVGVHTELEVVSFKWGAPAFGVSPESLTESEIFVLMVRAQNVLQHRLAKGRTFGWLSPESGPDEPEEEWDDEIW